MKLIIIIGIAVFIITWGLLLYAFFTLIRRINDIEDEVIHLSGKLRRSNDGNDVKKVSNEISQLKQGLKTTIGQMNVIENFVHSLTEEIRSFPPQLQPMTIVEEAPPRREERVAQDPKIWVRRKSGMKLLEKADGQHEMYLIKENSHYLLHLNNMEPENIIDMRNLYSDVIFFPPNVDSVTNITMIEHPKYEKRGEEYHFTKFGEIRLT